MFADWFHWHLASCWEQGKSEFKLLHYAPGELEIDFDFVWTIWSGLRFYQRLTHRLGSLAFHSRDHSLLEPATWVTNSIWDEVLSLLFNSTCPIQKKLTIWDGIWINTTNIDKNLNEILGCWATTFPNVGLILSLKALGEVFEAKAFFVVQDILSGLVFVAYLTVLILTMIAIYKGLVFTSQDQEIYIDEMNMVHGHDLEYGKFEEKNKDDYRNNHTLWAANGLFPLPSS